MAAVPADVAITELSPQPAAQTLAPEYPFDHPAQAPVAPVATGRWKLLPPLSEEERGLLRRSIIERGVEVPVIVDQHGELLDGYARAEIAAELGVYLPVEARAFPDDDSRARFVLELNLARRHLTIEQRRLLVRWLVGGLGWSRSRVAATLRVGAMTVSRDVAFITAADPAFRLPEQTQGRTRRLRDGTSRRYVRRVRPATHRLSGGMTEGRPGRAWLPAEPADVARLERVMLSELRRWTHHHALHLMGTPILAAEFGAVVQAINALPLPQGVRRVPAAPAAAPDAG